MNSPGWLHTAARAMGDKALRRHLAITDDQVLGVWCKGMAAQAMQVWRERYICPACGGHRPEHREGCEVVKQLGPEGPDGFGS
jgi:Zn finger protein HypA/HybF involved in hydrogenase expression